MDIFPGIFRKLSLGHECPNGRAGFLDYGRCYGQVDKPVFLCFEAAASCALILLNKVKIFVLKSSSIRNFLVYSILKDDKLINNVYIHRAIYFLF